jgi:hypothetical protein
MLGENFEDPCLDLAFATGWFCNCFGTDQTLDFRGWLAKDNLLVFTLGTAYFDEF